MKPKRLVLIFAPFACILFYALLVRITTQEIPRATTEGAQLKIASLSGGEEVVVQRLFAHRNVVAREYRIIASGATKQVSVFSLSDAWEDGRLKLTLDQVLAVRDLTVSEAEGLDQTVAFFRDRREEYSSAERHYRLSYFRFGKKIGEEFFIGFSLPSDLAYLRREGSASAQSYTELAERHDVTRDLIEKMVPFEELEPQTPNKAPEPTPVVVTPRAIERDSK